MRYKPSKYVLNGWVYSVAISTGLYFTTGKWGLSLVAAAMVFMFYDLLEAFEKEDLMKSPYWRVIWFLMENQDNIFDFKINTTMKKEIVGSAKHGDAHVGTFKTQSTVIFEMAGPDNWDILQGQMNMRIADVRD